jgi:arylsulfatase A-like enzyme
MSAHAGSFVKPAFRFDPDDDGKLGAYLFAPGGKASYRQIYDLRVRQVDEVLRRIFDELRARGILENALVVITSDHGQRTSEGGLLYHGGDADPPTLNIPLLVYDGNGGRYPERNPASQIDVAPTFSAAIGVEPLPAWRGSALQRQVARTAVPVGTTESSGAVVRHGGPSYLYLCDRASGAERVTPLDGAHPAPPLALLRSLHRSVAAPTPKRVC